jgi:uncharacterized membrane protein YphA (DoxX/SURF4 family)
VAVVSITHASNWLFGAFAGTGMGSGGLTTVSAYFASAGVSASFTFVLLCALLQLSGGVLLLAGYFTRVVSGVLIVVEVAKVSFDSARWGFFLNWTLDPTRGHGMEFSFVLVCVLGALLLLGAGEWSIDGIRARNDASAALGRARIRDRI